MSQAVGAPYSELGRVALFATLPANDLASLGACLRARRYAKGEAVCRKGDPGNCLYIVADGRVKLSLIAEDGREAILDLLESGDVFGELAVLDGEPRSADAFAIEPSRMFLLARDDFRRYLRQHPEVAIHLLGVLSQRLRRDTRVVEEAVFLNVPTRVARTLLRLAQPTTQESNPAHDGAREDSVTTPRLVQSDLAALVGTTRETLNKWLGILEDEQLIRRAPRGRIVVLRPVELQQRYAIAQL